MQKRLPVGGGPSSKTWPKMRTAPGAQDLYPSHAESMVGLQNDIQRRNRFVKTGPASPRFELRGTGEKIGVATDAFEDARSVDVVESTAARSLSSMFCCDFVFFIS